MYEGEENVNRSLAITLSVNGYGPFSDNAGGIAETPNLAKNICKRIDELDATGNTYATIGKGFEM